MQEEWRPIVGLEGSYEVSSIGNIRSLDRVVKYSNGVERLHRGKQLTTFPNRDGYLVVNIGGARRLVHRLVASAFHGPRKENEVTRHLNGDPSDNRVSNLRWGTQSENVRDTLRHGRHNTAGRSHCPRGHLLVPPNLVRAQLLKGRRTCLACNNASSYVHKYKNSYSRQEYADKKYEELMLRT